MKISLHRWSVSPFKFSSSFFQADKISFSGKNDTVSMLFDLVPLSLRPPRSSICYVCLKLDVTWKIHVKNDNNVHPNFKILLSGMQLLCYICLLNSPLKVAAPKSSLPTFPDPRGKRLLLLFATELSLSIIFSQSGEFCGFHISSLAP